MDKAEVCYLALSTDNQPYVVPLNFGYRDNTIYIHCAKEGRKIETIRANPRVSFAVHADMTIRDRDKPACDWSTSYRSVIGFGQAEIIDDFEQKRNALDIFMSHYGDKEHFQYSDASIRAVGIIKINITEMTGKQSM